MKITKLLEAIKRPAHRLPRFARASDVHEFPARDERGDFVSKSEFDNINKFDASKGPRVTVQATEVAEHNGKPYNTVFSITADKSNVASHKADRLQELRRNNFSRPAGIEVTDNGDGTFTAKSYFLSYRGVDDARVVNAFKEKGLELPVDSD